MFEGITLVTGLPRSGTSMVMQMLSAGGAPVLTDDLRAPDEHNPRGYFEYAPVKRLKSDAQWLPEARGKAIKVVSYLLPFLPEQEGYRVVFVERALEEVIASQNRMLGKGDAASCDASSAGAQLMEVLQLQNAKARDWIQRSGAPVLDLRHQEVIDAPRAQAERIGQFLGGDLDWDAMAAAVSPELHRQRSL
nr:TPR repeat protein [uncultured bacterium]